MVTIEKKLRLFENLIQHDISDKFQEESKKQEDYYNKLIMDNKSEENRISQEIISETKYKLEKAYSRAEAESKKNYRELIVEIKKELLEEFLSKLEFSLNKFIQMKEYENYLITKLNQISRDVELQAKLYVYMTVDDISRYENLVKDELIKSYQNNESNANNEYANFDIIVLEGSKEMIGGLIIENENRDLRFDYSIKKSIENSMPQILQGLNEIVEGEDK